MDPLELKLTPQLNPGVLAALIPEPNASSFGSFEKDDSPSQSSGSMGPPSLRYPIESKTKALMLTWSVIIFANSILPVTVFYLLRHVTHSSTDFILNVSQLPMVPTLLQFPYRLWQLKRRNGERSPRDRGRLTWDFCQWQFLFGALLTTAVCAFAGVVDSYKVFALAPPITFSGCCLQLIVFDILATSKVPQPCRISSVPKSVAFRPMVYYIIEDLTAVDGGGGAEYRDRLAERWKASIHFQCLVRDVGRIIGFSGLLMVGIVLALILMTPPEVFIGASWVVLWTWAALSTYFCVSYTRACLAFERDWWKLEANP